MKKSPLKKTFNLMFIGDVFGRVGRHLLKRNLANYRVKFAVDFIIANGENATNGCALSEKHFHEFRDWEIDVVTMGNHTFHTKETARFIDNEKFLIRPHNLPFNRPGKGTIVVKHQGLKIQITNLIGNTFMDGKNQDLFTDFLSLLNHTKIKPDIHIVDLHAEATAEKAAFAWAFDGQVTAVLGTHTHVQTNDARLLPQKTFFITDVGMTGPHQSIIGANPALIVNYELKGLGRSIQPAKGDGQLCAVVLQIDLLTKQVVDHQIIYDLFKTS